MEELARQLLSMDHWPWIAVAAILVVINQVLSVRIFTREQAYKVRITQPFWYWGRELLPIYPIMFGMTIGWWWPDPEGKGWVAQASVMYFGSAGALSLIAWSFLKALAKKRGIDLKLPGRNTEPPK
jgi:hypothetical protein